MKKSALSRLTAAAMLVAVGACTGDGPTTPLDLERAPDTRISQATWDPPALNGEAGVYVCKISYEGFVRASDPTYDPNLDPVVGVVFDFDVSVGGGGSTTYSAPAQAWAPRTSDECVLVYDGDADADVVITEQAIPGSSLISIFAEDEGFDTGGFVDIGAIDFATRTVTLTAVAGYTILYFKNMYDEPDLEPAEGRMTGGGVKAFGIDADGYDVRVTLGLTLHCDNLLSNNLEVNWPDGHQWHIKKESLTNILCTLDDDPTPPVAPISRFEATAVGRLDGEWGSLVRFVFEDLGEPGRDDRITMTIYPVGGGAPVLTIATQELPVGNFQMHYDQPHGQKPSR